MGSPNNNEIFSLRPVPPTNQPNVSATPGPGPTKICWNGPIPFAWPDNLDCPFVSGDSPNIPNPADLIPGRSLFNNASSFFSWIGNSNNQRGIGLILLATLVGSIGLVLWLGGSQTIIQTGKTIAKASE